MVLLPDHDDALYACVSDILEKEAHGLTLAKELESTLQAVVSAVQRAMANFSEAWNARKSVMLPPELLAKCFEYLTFDQCLLVSGVSQRWRAIALGAPSLWSAFKLPRVNNKKLAEMLRRSQATPLTIALCLADDEERLLKPHVPRLKSLTCAYPPSPFLLPLDAPQLETFRMASSQQHHVVLSEHLLGRSTSLRRIDVHGFTLPPVCSSMATVREFKGSFRTVEQFSALFELCPRLVSLEADCWSGISYEPGRLFMPLPDSLRELRLTGLGIQGRLESVLLAPWVRHQFRLLRLEYVANIVGFLQLFTQSYDGAWSMAVLREEQAFYVLSSSGSAPERLSAALTLWRSGTFRRLPEQPRAARARSVSLKLL
ncbi:hypothetical protein AURDEDRAFT_166166 [Auricularia subglabra TFB-10046 SS5]|nr:hypothetical protein AURDEDRAFT_166166 [Auricularia subglabra TFB-10046 SS5]